jgi:hypothetical protein
MASTKQNLVRLMKKTDVISGVFSSDQKMIVAKLGFMS